MQTYCVSCKRNTGNINATAMKTKDGRLVLKSTSSVCGHHRFISND